MSSEPFCARSSIIDAMNSLGPSPASGRSFAALLIRAPLVCE